MADYNEMLEDIETDREAELDQSDNEFETQISESEIFFKDQADKVDDWVDDQTNVANDTLKHTVNQINQQKDQAQKDYTKEQSAAYVDWQKAIDPYGANAEKMASSGLTNSGYSETSLVGMYNTYQNRVTAARESYNRAVLNYNNAIKDAQLQNSSILAEIAYQALQQQLELSLQGFQYKNTLVLEKAKARREINAHYDSKYLSVLGLLQDEEANGSIQINTNASKDTNSTTRGAAGKTPSKIITIDGEETYFVQGLGPMKKAVFYNLWNDGYILEDIKDGSVTYRTDVPKEMLEQRGLWNKGIHY